MSPSPNDFRLVFATLFADLTGDLDKEWAPITREAPGTAKLTQYEHFQSPGGTGPVTGWAQRRWNLFSHEKQLYK